MLDLVTDPIYDSFGCAHLSCGSYECFSFDGWRLSTGNFIVRTLSYFFDRFPHSLACVVPFHLSFIFVGVYFIICQINNGIFFPTVWQHFVSVLVWTYIIIVHLILAAIHPCIRFIYCINLDCFSEDEMDTKLDVRRAQHILPIKLDIMVSRLFFFFVSSVIISWNVIIAIIYHKSNVRHFNIPFAYQ